jgi:hypothetical protein
MSRVCYTNMSSVSVALYADVPGVTYHTRPKSVMERYRAYQREKHLLETKEAVASQREIDLIERYMQEHRRSLTKFNAALLEVIAPMHAAGGLSPWHGAKRVVPMAAHVHMQRARAAHERIMSNRSLWRNDRTRSAPTPHTGPQPAPATQARPAVPPHARLGASGLTTTQQRLLQERRNKKMGKGKLERSVSAWEW